jgi:hypothetical protein
VQTVACRHASTLNAPRSHSIANFTNGRFLAFHAAIFASTLLALTTTHKSTIITEEFREEVVASHKHTVPTTLIHAHIAFKDQSIDFFTTEMGLAFGTKL